MSERHEVHEADCELCPTCDTLDKLEAAALAYLRILGCDCLRPRIGIEIQHDTVTIAVASVHSEDCASDADKE